MAIVASGSDTVDAVVVSVDGGCCPDVYGYHLVPLSGGSVCVLVGTHLWEGDGGDDERWGQNLERVIEKF